MAWVCGWGVSPQAVLGASRPESLQRQGRTAGPPLTALKLGANKKQIKKANPPTTAHRLFLSNPTETPTAERNRNTERRSRDNAKRCFGRPVFQ